MAVNSSSGFSIWRLLWSNLSVRPVRLALSIVAISLQVFLILLIVGLTAGAMEEWGKRVEGVGADIMVQPPNSSIFFAFSGAVLQESIGERIRQLHDVDEVAPVLIVTDTRTMTIIYGIDYQRFNALSQGFLFRDGRRFETPDEAIVDDLAAQSRKLKVGDKVLLLGHEFTVSGVVEHGKGARFFLPLNVAQDLAGADKRVSMFYVRSAGDTERARQQIVRLLPNHQVRSVAEYVTLMNSANLPELKPFIGSMVGLGVAISFLVVLLTMHTVVLERTREIGILKALGSSRLDILRLILGETVLMSALGAVVGLVATYGVCALLKHTSPTTIIKIPLDWNFHATWLVVLAAIAGALYPAYRAAQADPVDALAYE